MLSIYQFIDFNLIRIINHVIINNTPYIKSKKKNLIQLHSLLPANVKNSSSNFTRKSNNNEIYLFVEN